MQQILDTIGLVVKYLAPALLAIYFLIAGGRRALHGFKEFWLYRKLIHNDSQGETSRFFERLSKLPPETIPDILSKVLLPVDDALYLEKLIREYSQILPKET
ncbi:MAG: hypothetical protein HYU84_16045, partial [Chloroflexi bacterium]|nr:hypothetical protein [Chloroflexota bacterium]